ncbi:MAG: molybdopterin synthase sulfur carrier subunit [Myxococcales bacterium]
MRVHVHYFARCRELAEISEDTLTLPDGATVEQLAAALIDLRPRLARILPSVRMAVNQEFAAPASPLADGDEVALIPPVSGGAPDERFVITGDPITPDAAVALLRDSPEDRGALATFAGVVRRRSNLGKDVTHLEYEAYPPMAVRMMRVIEAEARERWSLLDLAIVHRTGRVDIGGVAVSIAVSSVHRAEALEACRYVIDRLKQDVPIWKKETSPAGEEWWSEGS